MSSNDRWRYLVVSLRTGWKGTVANEKLQAELDSQGILGWELVSVLPEMSGIKLVFKRPA